MKLSTTQHPYFTESDADYFTSTAWSQSNAKCALVSPRLALMRHTGQDKREDTDSLAFGRAWDRIVNGFQPPRELFAVKPEGMSFASNAGKAWKQDAEASGLEIISERTASKLESMLQYLPADIVVKLIACQFQQVARVNYCNLSMQSKVDALSSHNVLYDCKTTAGYLEDFEASAYRYGYHFQAAWYRMVHALANPDLPTAEFHFIVTETCAPYRTAIFIPSAAFMSLGQADVDKALATITECAASGDWQDKRTIRALDLPPWAKRGQANQPTEQVEE
jgi:hypothetical protein